MQILNKFAAFIIIGVIAYLAYSSLSQCASVSAAQDKEMPVVTKKMIIPTFVEVQSRVSPIDRDPFDTVLASKTARTDLLMKKQTNDGGGNDVLFPEKLMGILSGSDGQQLALIGGEVYSVGSYLTLSDSNEPWEVSSIGEESVVLSSNGMQTVLKINNDFSEDGNVPAEKTGNQDSNGVK